MELSELDALFLFESCDRDRVLATLSARARLALIVDEVQTAVRRKLMPIEVSKLLEMRKKTPVTFTLVEDGQVKEETIEVIHRALSPAMLDALDEIERSDVTEPPKVTQQLLLLDVRSDDLTKDGQPVPLTAAVWAEIGLPAQHAIGQAILANDLLLWMARRTTEKTEKLQRKSKGKKKDEAQETRELIAGSAEETASQRASA